MSDSGLKTIQQLVQDVIAPDVRELKVRVNALEKQMETQFAAMQKHMETQFAATQKQMETQFAATHKQSDAQFQAVMAAVGESKAKSDLETARSLSVLGERVAVLEATRQ